MAKYLLDKTGSEVNEAINEQYDGDQSVIQGWTDLRIAANATTVNGSNPPTDALFKNDGNEIPGTAYALSFLSTNLGNLNLPDDVILDTSADFTMSFWLRPTVSTENNIELMRKQNVFTLSFAGADQINLDVTGVGSALSTIAFNRGSWNFITIQHNTTDGNIYLYINAQLAVSISGAMSDNSNNFVFNRQETLFDIDYIEYWDVSQTPAVINNRYASGAGLQLIGNEVGLKGLWELNDGSGSIVVEKTGIVSDGSISGGSEGVQWAWIGGHVGNTSPGSRGVILKYFSPDILNELYFDVQMPHEWKEGSEIRPHIHWIPNANGTAGQDVTFGLEYTWSNVGEVFGDTTTIFGSVNHLNETLIKDKHYITSLGNVDASGMTLSSMFVCRVFRDAENITDTFDNFVGFLEIDIHYQIDQERGSRQEFIK